MTHWTNIRAPKELTDRLAAIAAAMESDDEYVPLHCVISRLLDEREAGGSRTKRHCTRFDSLPEQVPAKAY